MLRTFGSKMKLQHTLGIKERTKLVIERNWFTGSVLYRENGEVHRIQNPWNPSTHSSLRLSREYEFEVGDEEKHSIKVIHSRPRYFAGFRHQTFDVFANGKLLESFTGY